MTENKAIHIDCGGEIVVRIDKSVTEESPVIFQTSMTDTQIIHSLGIKLNETVIKETDKMTNFICLKCGNILRETDMKPETKILTLIKGGKNEREEE